LGRLPMGRLPITTLTHTRTPARLAVITRIRPVIETRERKGEAQLPLFAWRLDPTIVSTFNLNQTKSDSTETFQ